MEDHYLKTVQKDNSVYSSVEIAPSFETNKYNIYDPNLSN